MCLINQITFKIFSSSIFTPWEAGSRSPRAVTPGRDVLMSSAGALRIKRGRLRPVKFCFNNTTLSYPWLIRRDLITRMATSSANPPRRVKLTLLQGFDMRPRYNERERPSYMNCSHYWEMIKNHPPFVWRFSSVGLKCIAMKMVSLVSLSPYSLGRSRSTARWNAAVLQRTSGGGGKRGT